MAFSRAEVRRVGQNLAAAQQTVLRTVLGGRYTTTFGPNTYVVDGRRAGEAINNAGHAVGTAETQTQGHFQAFFDDGAQTHRLGALQAGHFSTALAVNNSDQVVGVSAPTLRFLARGGNQGDDFRLNAAGQVALPAAADRGRAFVWSAGGQMRALGELPGGGWSIAYDINDAGVAVGTGGASGTATPHAVLWLGGTAYDLNSLVDGVPAGVVLTEARGINRSGQVVATGVNADNVSKAYFLDVKGLLALADDAVSAGNRKAVDFNPLANDQGGSGATVTRVDTAALQGRLTWDARGNFTYDPTTAFADLPVGQTRQTSFTYTVADGRGNTATATARITVTGVPALSSFHVMELRPTASGFEAALSHDLDPAVLNLYDGQDAAADAADVTLTGAASGAVRGTLEWDAGARAVRFVATGGTLAADRYTVRMSSRRDGVARPSGELLDGNADGAAGGDFVREFTVLASTARVIGLPDFARGPGQPIDLPAGTTTPAAGLPLSISNGDGVRAVQLVVEYDPTLLQITGAALDAAMPGGWSVTPNLATPGRAVIALHATNPLPAGQRTLARLTAAVPSTAPYRAGQVLKITQLSVNGGAIPAEGDAAVHKVAYPGDATGNGGSGAYSGLDASWVARLAAGLDSGLDQYPLTDPRIVAAVSGGAAVNALDASDVARRAVNLPTPNIPALPAGLPLTPVTGPDPVVSAPAETPVQAGGSAVLSLTIDQAAGLQALDLSVGYDAAMLNLTPSDLTAGSLLAGAPAPWTLVTNRDEQSGKLVVTAYSTQPLPAGGGELLRLTTRPAAGVTAGSSPVDLEGSLNEGQLTLTPVDGRVTVGGGVTPPPAARVTGRSVFYNRSAYDGNDPLPTAADDAAIDAAKSALLPGQTATAANVTSYSRGINGVMIDVAGLPPGTVAGNLLGVNDVSVRTTSAAVPTAWSAGPAPSSVTVRPGAGVGGSDRVTLIWADGAITNRWAEVTLLANGDTGLAAPDVFAFGSLIGDADGSRAVNLGDFGALRQDFGRTGLSIAGGRADFNRDRAVNLADFGLLRGNFGKPLAAPPALSASAAATAASPSFAAGLLADAADVDKGA